MRKAIFSIESLGNHIFEGFTVDETWNGWACPYFTYDEALKIAKAQKMTGAEARYEENIDSFVFNFQGEEETFAPVEIENLKLYPIGNSSWIWDEKEVSNQLA